jgi:hypothetical protein
MLTLDLVDRLLASRLVPRAAKLAAIESWRRELAAMREKQSECLRLEQRLAEASGLLAAPWPWAAAVQYLSRVLGLWCRSGWRGARADDAPYPRQYRSSQLRDRRMAVRISPAIE